MIERDGALSRIGLVVLCIATAGTCLLLDVQAEAQDSPWLGKSLAQILATPKPTSPTPYSTPSGTVTVVPMIITKIVATVPIVTPSPTPTSQPGPPQLLLPADGAQLPQPVPPGEWFFQWDAKTGPCYNEIHIEGPGQRHIDETIYWQDTGYRYSYTTGEPLPDDALEPWYWDVEVHCLGGHNLSETRTFRVESAPLASPAVPEATTIVLMVVSASGLGGYLVLQQRARRRR